VITTCASYATVRHHCSPDCHRTIQNEQVVMLGDTFAGKTSLVLRFAEGHYRDSARSATVGAFFITKRLSVQGMTCKIQIWDTAGQEQFKCLAPMYYKNAAAAIVCYDVTSPKSFETLRYWIDELQQNVPAGRIVLAMCATKCDLSTHPDTSAAEQLAEETGAMFLTTSAKNNENVTELFEQVAERVLQLQKQNSGIDIPVTLGTFSVDAATNGNLNMESHPAHAQPRILTPNSTSQHQHEHDHERSLMDEKKQDDEDDLVDRIESKDSVEYEKRCDSNMFMCGDIMQAHESMNKGEGCCIL
jgi:small GTP-binding protein